MIGLGQFLEVLIGGLMSGVLYSLVALGFVLIFKASGVVNFAQGAMVLLAGLALVRSLDLLVAWGFPLWTAIIFGIGFAAVIMAITAWLIEQFVIGPLVTRTASAVHVHHRHDIHPRGCGADDLRFRCLPFAAVSDGRLVPV